MQSFMSVVWSSVGNKILNGLTGLFLSLFVLGHLAGNTALFMGPKPFNLYSDFLMSLGSLIIAIELGLVLIVLIHALAAVMVWISKLQGRPEKYSMVTNAGGESHKTWSSVTMIYTGVLIFAFIVYHVTTFKYGAYYTAVYNGKEVRDLYKLVVEAYSNPIIVVWYELIMILLGMHLRHGFWSAFQSLGVNHPKYSPIIKVVGWIIALVVSLGFLAIPLYLFITGGVQ